MDQDGETVGMFCDREHNDNEGEPTASSYAQEEVEQHVESIFKSYDYLSGLDTEPGFPLLRREQHKQFLLKSLMYLPESFSKLDASQPWMLYWILHSLALLDVRLEDKMKDGVIKHLQKCHNTQTGGYGGGPFQYGHLAPTYAALNSYVLVGTPEIWSTIDKVSMTDFLFKLRVGDGSFLVHEGGESDIRAVYCAVVVAKILNIQAPDLFEGSIEWIVRCQTYEGGFGGDPGQEAHGGYSFCAVAALYLLQGLHMCDLKALLRWTVNRQMKYEGGFQGRTNKLVDSCYSFWQGATVVLAQMGLHSSSPQEAKTKEWMFDEKLLQEYVLLCCQDPYGGIIDKPKVHKDPYHTCYGLSGLSIAQGSDESRIVGDAVKNKVKQVHPAFNLPVDKLSDAMAFFYGSKSS
ncbi:hypothetical protein GE061_019485 [Apolygus lucorum]|uniref:Protein farnesyltransferase subunit beta n=1 Tax=Apolygus lucorum TaxID=248454 RepID=A0A6A4JZT7_APOLU|nr:hypothetical protein GE061_019485 [Apolygus lucorum]